MRKLEKDFTALELQHVPRADNSAADDLSQRASTQAPVPEGVFERRLLRPAAQPAGLGEGGETGTSKSAVPVASQNAPKAVCALGDSADPLAPQSTTQSSPDAVARRTLSRHWSPWTMPPNGVRGSPTLWHSSAVGSAVRRCGF